MTQLNEQLVTEEKRGISGSTLKLIAVITMLIDHAGAVILGRMLWDKGVMTVLNGSDPQALLAWMNEHGNLFWIYTLMRMIGRVAFPIFIFLMVEGLSRTSNRWKYLGRMGAFALISEIPFNLALTGQIWSTEYQSVYFTLSIGLLAMIICDTLEERLRAYQKSLVRIGYWMLVVLITVAAAVLAEFLQTDYGAIGIVCIMVIYITRRKKIAQTIGGALVFIWEVTAPLAFIPVWFYNGKRGLKLKYLFYIFYPAHLLILYLIIYFMGLGAYPAL